MSTYPRKYQTSPKVDQAAHAGLLLSRFVPVEVIKRADDGLRIELLNNAIAAACRAKAVYALAYQKRCERLLQFNSVEIFTLATKGRLAVGLGNASAMEIGLTLHHVYGVPIIPGQALKGLALRYANATIKDVEQLKNVANILFGANNNAGFVDFEDAWILPDSLVANGIVLDVMTPHHPDYYEGKSAPPSDQDDPRPLPFLAATGSFSFAVHCDVTGDNSDKWCEYAANLLQGALTQFTWGVGAKTRQGYGLFRPLDSSATQS